MNRKTLSIVGYGSLIFDHIFVENLAGELIYKESRGGGSLGNLLVGLSTSGIRTAAIGTCGKDVYGELAKNELAQLNVDISQVYQIKSKKTRVIFQNLKPINRYRLKSVHSFTSRCFVCGQIPSSKCLDRPADFTSGYHWDWKSFSVFCIDRLTKDRIEHVSRAKEFGLFTVLDLGQIQFLRYLPSTQILGYISLFDFVLMPRNVAKSLEKRARLENITDILEIGNTKILCVSKDEEGMMITLRESLGRLTHLHVSPQNGLKPIDTAGAGDSFLAKFLFNLHRNIGDQLSEVKIFSPSVVMAAAQEATFDLSSVLQSYGSRGHLAFPDHKSATENLVAFRGKNIDMLKAEVRDMPVCPFCNTSKERAILNGRALTIPSSHNHLKRFGMRKNIAHFLQRVFFSLERKDAIEQCADLMEKTRTAYVVGTGGSFPAATFIAQLVTWRNMKKGREGIVQAIRPYDYVRLSNRTDSLIVVSYSGKTHDCRMAIKHAIEIGVQRIALVTGARKPKLAGLLRTSDEDIAYRINGSGGERGFVSIAGTVSPCALWAAAVEKPQTFAEMSREIEERKNGKEELIEQLADHLRHKGILNVFGGNLAWPAMLDIESKFTEGGIGTAHLHESKDFSHGRFILVFDKIRVGEPKVLIKVGKHDAYESMLQEKLEEKGPLAIISSERDGPIGALEVLIEVQFFIQNIACALGKDISRPSKIDRTGLDLYRWNPAEE